MSILGKIVESGMSYKIASSLSKPIEMLDKASAKLQNQIDNHEKHLFECSPGTRALLINQSMYTWTECFNVFDNYESIKYKVKGEFTSVKRHFHIYDNRDNEVGYVKEKLISFRPSALLEAKPVDFTFKIRGRKKVHMKSKWSMVKDKFCLDNGWYVEGNFSSWKYKIYDNQKNIIANVQTKILYWGDTYLITFPEDADDLLILMIVLSIDTYHSPNKVEDLKETIRHKSHNWINLP